MTELTVYQCEHCKKLFRTQRHQCKFRPELKNCFTCKKFNCKWEENRCGGYCEPPYPDCEYIEDWNIYEMKKANYNMQCEEWEAKAK